MKEFYTAVNFMRQYQKLYFTTPREEAEKKREYLIKSKEFEKIVDGLLAKMFFDEKK